MKMLCNNKGKVGAGKDKGYEQYLYTHTNISLITVVFTHFISHLFNTANTIKLLLPSIITNGLHYANRRAYQVNKVLTMVNIIKQSLHTCQISGISYINHISQGLWARFRERTSYNTYYVNILRNIMEVAP